MRRIDRLISLTATKCGHSRTEVAEAAYLGALLVSTNQSLAKVNTTLSVAEARESNQRKVLQLRLRHRHSV
jgi:hypothetical protein